MAATEIQSERVSFPGGLGHVLAARLDHPPADLPPAAWVLMAHCFTCGKDVKGIHRISKVLAERGLGVLRFDFTGVGESGGDFSQTSFSSNVADLCAATEYLRSTGRTPIVLAGHSLGGAAALVAAPALPSVRGVATIAAASRAAHLRDVLARKNPRIEADGAGDVTIGGRRFRVRREFLDDLLAHEVLDAARNLGRPLLVLHSPADKTVGIEHARQLFEAARHPKSFVSLGRADHLLATDAADAVFVGELLAAWARWCVEQT